MWDHNAYGSLSVQENRIHCFETPILLYNFNAYKFIFACMLKCNIHISLLWWFPETSNHIPIYICSWLSNCLYWNLNKITWFFFFFFLDLIPVCPEPPNHGLSYLRIFGFIVFRWVGFGIDLFLISSCLPAWDMRSIIR